MSPTLIDIVQYNVQLYLYWPPFPAVVMMPSVALFGVNVSDVLVTMLFGALNVGLVALLLNLLVGAQFAGFVLLPGYATFLTFREYIDHEHQTTEAFYVDLGQKVKAVTPGNGQVIILQKNLEPNLVWEAERKALLLTYYNTYLFTCQMTQAANYTTVVDTFGSADLERVLACFARSEQSDPGVYKVWR